MSFDHLMEKKPKEELNSDVISLKADIEALKLKLLETPEDVTCQLDEDSETIKGMRIIEQKVQQIMEKVLGEFEKDPSKIEKSKIDNCAGIILILDKYRHIKVQLELLKSTKFSTSPISQ